MSVRPPIPAFVGSLNELTRRVRDLVNGMYQGTTWPSRWDDVRIPVTSAKPGATRVPDFAQFIDDGAGSTGVYTYMFDDTTEEELFFSVQLPHSYKEYSTISPHLHWAPSDASASGVVVWGIELTISNISATFSTSTIMYSTSTAVAQYHHTIAEFGDLTASAATISAMILGRVFRAASATADTYGADAALLEIDFHIEKDEMGSLREYNKWLY